MALLFRQHDMEDIDWWNKIPKNEPGLHIPDEHGRAMLRKGFSQFIAIGFLMKTIMNQTTLIIVKIRIS